MFLRLQHVLAASALAPSCAALCDPGQPSESGDDALALVQRAAGDLSARIMASPGTVGTEASAGGVVGFATGFAAKRAGAVLLFCAGSLFGLLRGLEHNGWIEMKHSVIEADIINYLDQDGDGKLTASDLDAMQRRTLVWLQAGVPTGSGFGAGFLLGLRL